MFKTVKKVGDAIRNGIVMMDFKNDEQQQLTKTIREFMTRVQRKGTK